MRQTRPAFTVLSLAAVGGLIVACGARGPLDLEVVDVYVTADASGVSTTPGQGDGGPPGTTTPSEDAGGGSTGPGGGSSGGTPPGIPGLSEDGGLLGCGTCVASQCSSSIATCFADPTCAASLECILTTCLTGGATGGGGLTCFTTCAGSSGITTLLPILTCIAGTCGTDCGSLLGGVGGF